MEIDYNLLLSQFRVFLLVFVRITSMVVATPIFSSALIRVPPQLLAGLGSALSLVVMMNLPASISPPDFGGEYALRAIGEAFVGFSVGFMAVLILAGIQFGGEVIDHMIGFAIADVIDPISNESASLIGNFKSLLATVLFLLLHGHHHLFRGLMRTFELVPPGGVGMGPSGGGGVPAHLWVFLQGYGEALFVVGLQVAAPCLLVMTLLWIPEGFLARMVPQLNLLVNDVPMRIAIGLIVVWLGIGPFVHLTEGLIESIAAASDRIALIVARA
jgi:flagellar biosynthetic protein FliR